MSITGPRDWRCLRYKMSIITMYDITPAVRIIKSKMHFSVHFLLKAGLLDCTPGDLTGNRTRIVRMRT